MNYVLWKRIWIFWIMWFSRENTNRCIRVYVRFKDDKHVIWMWIWLILKNISLLDRIWSLWLVHLAHSPPNFIFWFGRLIFLESINSHPDNIYISPYFMFPSKVCWQHVSAVLKIVRDRYTCFYKAHVLWCLHDAALWDKVCQWLVKGHWFFLDNDCHDITTILL